MTNKEAGHASCELCDDEREAAWSQDTQRSEASQPVLPSELVEAARDHVSPKTSYYPDTWKRLVAALASLPDPLQTVESVRAEYLAELIKRADDQCAKITDSSPLIVREALNASCWLRFQKGEG